ncbi:MAG: hypothetical protein KAI24_04000, partial [Planctomycetes bacterium]|nr:hypothetical protein [Planctomycetota bacterium]
HLLVRGRLLDEQREPLPGWRVVAVADGASADQAVARALAYWQHTTTDARGAFELFGTERGPLLVQCMPEGAFQLDAGHREAGVGVGTTGLDIVVPASKLRRSKLTGRIVGADGGQLTEATVRTYVRRDPPPRCEQGRFVYEGLAHGKAVVIFEAPGHGSRRVVFEVDQAEQDVGDIVLQPAVELRVRPRLADGGEWRGPLPAPAIRTADGRYHEPQPTAFADGGQLVIRTLSPGSYLLVPSRSEQVAAAPLPFTLRVGEPVQLDWPVRVGRRRLLRFQPPADLPAVDGTVLSLRVVHENGAVELEHQQEVHRGAWFVRHTFVPGRYRVTATTPAGHRFEGGFEVILQKDEAEVATEVVVPPRR